jgi:hypothetical protein
VGHELALLFLSDYYLGSGNDGTGEGRSGEVDVLVDSVALYGRETQLFHELVVEVLDAAFLCTYLGCLFTASFEVLLLSDGSHGADNVVSFFNQPRHCGNVSFVYFSSMRHDASLLTAF